MPTSALVLTLPEALEAQAEVRARLLADARLTLGPKRGRKLALVAQTDDPADDARLFEALLALPGVSVDLVRYDFPDVERVDALPTRRRRPQPGDGGADGAP